MEVESWLITWLTSDPKLEGSNPAPVGTELMKMADIKIKCLISHKVTGQNFSQKKKIQYISWCVKCMAGV
jgi:hypothetical protein